MKQILKKIIALTLSCFLILGSTAFANEASTQTPSKMNVLPKITHSENYKYSFENYLKVLPFKLNEQDEKKAKKVFKEITNAFLNGKYDDAQKLNNQLYNIVDDYWMSEKTLKIILPFDEMITSIGKILTAEQKTLLKKEFAKLTILRNNKDFKTYFEQVRKIHVDYFKALGSAIGDSNNELQLLAYIKDAEKLTQNDLVKYSFDDYLKILPFHISEADYVKGKEVFDQIGKQLKVGNNKKANNLTAKLNDMLLPYWLKEEARKNLLPHESYKISTIKNLDRADQLKLNNIFKEIESARKASNYKLYFEKMDAYYVAFGVAIQNYYFDYFNEVVFIQ